MNIVIIKHLENTVKYMFSVPEGKTLKEGDFVKVLTKRGETLGVCVCDSFELSESPLKVIMEKYGATKPLSPVIGTVSFENWTTEG